MKNEGLKALLDMVGGLLAFLAAFLFLAEAIILQGWFEAPDIVGQIISIVKQYGLIVLVGIVGLEFVSNKNLIIKLLFIVAMAAVVIFQFFPGTWDSLVEKVGGVVGK